MVQRKRQLINAPHVGPLNDWVRSVSVERGRSIRDSESVTPWFDPSMAGVNTKVLVLLEAPGRRATASRGSGFVSIDNNDGTAANLFTLFQESGLQRADVALWNIVPWYLPAGQKTKPTKRSDVLEAQPFVEQLIPLFSQLRIVVTMGKMAGAGWSTLCQGSSMISNLSWRAVPHPSATNLNVNPSFREDIRNAFMDASAQIG
ncbi:uracil-DNA glycosylase [Arthrobacter pigmenti]|uniref:Uracil-DNA glycosylase n=1 Tax=Arthrobacter pigmenti TaxID=271432 RepID=A0A846RJY9_9MICC|nr:uracil-DNA glycosylase [Arthrobacter pigmenti]NJC21459.1 uracil-DNA glycosylase [Arthrobacter pigmenti]